MLRQSRTKLIPPKPEPEKNQALETLEESSLPEQKEEPALSELDMEINARDVMRLWNYTPTLMN
jgi:hypothetical protein